MYDAFMYVSHTLSNFVLCVPAVSQFDLQSVNQSNFSLIIVTVSLSLSLSHITGSHSLYTFMWRYHPCGKQSWVPLTVSHYWVHYSSFYLFLKTWTAWFPQFTGAGTFLPFPTFSGFIQSIFAHIIIVAARLLISHFNVFAIATCGIVGVKLAVPTIQQINFRIKQIWISCFINFTINGS